MSLAAFIRSQVQRRCFSVALCSLLLTAAMTALFALQPAMLRQADHKVYDLLLPLLRSRPSPAPIIIDIDENSLERYGQWPWPRYLMARLLALLAEKGVSAVALDVLLAEPDRTSPERMQEHLKRDLGIGIGFTDLPPELADYDRLLAEVVAGLPVVLGGYARYGAEDGGGGGGEADPPGALRYALLEEPGAIDILEKIPRAGKATFPLPLLRAAAPVGMVNMSPDMDGIVREVPMLTRVGDALYPGLSLRALMTALGRNSVVLGAGPDGLSLIKAGPYTLPVTPGGAALVPFQGPRKSYPYYRAVDVLEGTIAPEDLSGRIAFVGTSAPGLMDIRATPFDRVYPGVEVHATMLDAMLSGRSIQIPPWSPGLQIMLIALCGLLCALAFGFARPRVYIPTGLVLVCGCVWLSRQLFLQGQYLSPVYALLTVALSGSALLCVRFAHAEMQKRQLRSTFSRYVAPEVVRRITRLSGDIFAGEERNVTIMFTDIRGFTAISETLNTQQIVTLLNRYFTPMTALVRANQGTLDKFMGDALMAFWNAPLEVEGHPALAVKSGLEMQRELVGLNESLEREFGLRITMGVGLHTGKAHAGNMGSRELISYTLIGDSVNLASRLEGLCPQYGVGIVVSDDTRKGCGRSFAFQPLDSIRVKGKLRPVDIFTPMPRSAYAGRLREMQAWEEALALYRQGDFAAAAMRCGALHEEYPSTALYDIYVHRAAVLNAAPPRQWDGIWTVERK